MGTLLDTIVIGGGQAGLASGYYLQKNGLQFLILEAHNQAVGSWPQYYDSLKLFSPARFSSLPGMPISALAESYPLKEEVIRYLEAYSRKFKLPIKTNQQVEFVQKKGEVFEVRTKSGESYLSKTIINATGSFHNPYTPIIKGHDEFQGRILHASEYRNPIQFANQRVVVVGRGNSAVQIAIELAEVSKTSLAVLQPVQFMKQSVLGRDLHFWIKILGIDNFPYWRFGKNAPTSSSVIDLGLYKERLAAGKPDQQPMFNALFSNGVIWPHGKKETVDTIIFATGYRPNISYLKDIGALDIEGRPLQLAGISSKVQGLYYVGLEGQRSFASATLRGVGPDALYVVRQLIGQLHKLKIN